MRKNKFTIPIVAPTCRKYEKYCDGLLELMDKAWPGHPSVCFVSDGNSIRHKNRICVKSDSWVERLYQALRLIKGVNPGMEYVFVILEEKFPLFPCNQEKLVEMQDIAIKYKLNCVSFTSTVSSWPVVTFDKTKLHLVPQIYYYYSQNSSGIWRLEHLLDTCKYALTLNLHDVWLFERIVTSGHYESGYCWPNVLGGLFQRGWVNLKALKAMQLPGCQKLKAMLKEEYLLQQFGSRFAREKNKLEMNDMIFVLKAIGNKERLKILALLKEAPLNSEAIMRRLNLSQAKLSQQLKILLSSRLVVELRECEKVRFCLNPEPNVYCFYSDMLKLIRNGALKLS